MGHHKYMQLSVQNSQDNNRSLTKNATAPPSFFPKIQKPDMLILLKGMQLVSIQTVHAKPLLRQDRLHATLLCKWGNCMKSSSYI